MAIEKVGFNTSDLSSTFAIPKPARSNTSGFSPRISAGFVIPKALTIAGSDSGGGAGIQADLKTFAALGVHGSSAIAALTAQNTMEVRAVHTPPPSFLVEQIRAVLDDIGADSVKIGMLANAELITAVAETLRPLTLPIILDPVMVAASGAKLLEDSAVEALKKELIPLAGLITPNIPEAEVLLGHPVTRETMESSAKELLGLGCGAVLLKGGHLEGKDITDIFISGKERFTLTHPKLPTDAHGTGCTLSSAVAAFVAKGEQLPEAVRHAIAYVQGSLKHGYPVGKKNIILAHFWRWS